MEPTGQAGSTASRRQMKCYVMMCYTKHTSHSTSYPLHWFYTFSYVSTSPNPLTCPTHSPAPPTHLPHPLTCLTHSPTPPTHLPHPLTCLTHSPTPPTHLPHPLTYPTHSPAPPTHLPHPLTYPTHSPAPPTHLPHPLTYPTHSPASPTHLPHPLTCPTPLHSPSPLSLLVLGLQSDSAEGEVQTSSPQTQQ